MFKAVTAISQILLLGALHQTLDHLLAETIMSLLQTDRTIRIIIKRIKLEHRQVIVRTEDILALSEHRPMFHHVQIDLVHQLQEVAAAQAIDSAHQAADHHLDQCLHLLEAVLQDRLLQAAQEGVLLRTEGEDDK